MANQVIQVVLGMGSFALLSRWLVPYDYGLFGMAATVTAFVGVVGDVGVSSAVVRLAQVDAVTEASAFWLAIGGAAILTALTAIAAPFIAWFYREPAITPLAVGLAATFLAAAPGRVPGAMLARGLRLRATTIIGVITNAASIIVAIGLASRGFGAWALVTQTLLSAGLGSLLSCVAAPPSIRLGLVSRSRAREMAGFSSRLSGFSFATMIGRSLDNVLAGRLLGSGAVGLMTMGARLIFVPIERLSGAIYSVFLPALAQLSNVERQAAAFRSTLRLLFMAVGPLALGTVAIAPEIVALLPPKWAGLAPLLRVYAITALFLPVNYLSLSVLVGHGRASVLLRTSIALIPICWAGAAFGALSGSVLVMTLAWSFAITLGVSVAFWFAWRELGLSKTVWRSITVPLGVSAAMASAVWAIVHLCGLGGKRGGFAVGAATGAVIYVVLLQFTMAPDVSRIVTLLRRSLARPKAAL
jgi:O-antigen/teichoic acid export membrane protein